MLSTRHLAALGAPAIARAQSRSFFFLAGGAMAFGSARAASCHLLRTNNARYANWPHHPRRVSSDRSFVAPDGVSSR